LLDHGSGSLLRFLPMTSEVPWGKGLGKDDLGRLGAHTLLLQVEDGALRQILEQDVPDHQPPAVPFAESSSATDESPAAEPTPAEDPLEQDRAIVRELAVGWGLPESEVDHVLNHHRDPQKAKNILWGARLQRTRQPSPQPTLTESAA
jgi:hypothetical protein